MPVLEGAANQLAGYGLEPGHLSGKVNYLVCYKTMSQKNENTEEHTVSYTEDNTGEANANI